MPEKSPLKEAQEKFVQAIPAAHLAQEDCPTSLALNRIATTAIIAPIDSPPYSRAIVEGFLVRSEDTATATESSPAVFRINGSVMPGDTSCPAPEQGQAIEVATGSLVPAGNYSIVRMWEAKRNGDSITAERPFEAGFFIEAQGCDIAKNSTIIEAGQLISVEDIGLLASLGVDSLSVRKQPEITLFASGNEVIELGTDFRAGAIFDCNTPMLSAAIKQAGGIAISGGIMKDDFDIFLLALKSALEESDMVVISGGTAVGGRDFVSDLIRETGDLIVDGVPMKSGRPLIMGIANNKPIVCVAGHPPEALRGFRLFGVAAINQLTGRQAPLPEEGR